MTEPSNRELYAVERIHESLEVGERVLVFGSGTDAAAAKLDGTLALWALIILAVLPLLFAGLVWLTTSIALIGFVFSPVFFLIATAAITFALIHLLGDKGDKRPKDAALKMRSGWYALTSSRLLYLGETGGVSTLVPRSAVARIEASSQLVKLVLTHNSPSGKPSAIRIKQVHGLPPVVGGVAIGITSTEKPVRQIGESSSKA